MQKVTYDYNNSSLAPNYLYIGDKKILDLAVRCENTDRGCRWEGTVGTLDYHMDECDFTLIHCPNKCEPFNADASIMKKDLQMHLLMDCVNRSHKCAYCGMEGEHYSITGYHSRHCKKKIIVCPNKGCTQEFEQVDKERHLKSCEYSEVSCKYYELGCTVKKMRRDIGLHEQDDVLHLTAASDTVANLKAKVDTLQEKKASFQELNVKVLKPGESLIFRLDKYSHHKTEKDSFELNPFYTSPMGYKASITIHLDRRQDGTGTNGYVSVYLNIKKGYYDETLDWPSTVPIKVELLNQLSDNQHYNKTWKYNKTPHKGLLVGGCSGFPSFISHDALEGTSYGKQYLMKDTVYFRVSLEVDKPWLTCTV